MTNEPTDNKTVDAAPNEIMTEAETAALLQIGESTLNRLRRIRSADVPPHRVIGNAIRYSRPAVMEWMAGKTSDVTRQRGRPRRAT